MSLGNEFANLAAELLLEDDNFGSTFVWRHVDRIENASTGEVTEAITDETVRAALIDPIRLQLFSDTTLQRATTAMLLPPTMEEPPLVLDRVEITSGEWMTAVEVRRILGPGDGGPPVPVAWAVALGAM